VGRLGPLVGGTQPDYGSSAARPRHASRGRRPAGDPTGTGCDGVPMQKFHIFVTKRCRRNALGLSGENSVTVIWHNKKIKLHLVNNACTVEAFPRVCRARQPDYGTTVRTYLCGSRYGPPTSQARGGILYLDEVLSGLRRTQHIITGLESRPARHE